MIRKRFLNTNSYNLWEKTKKTHIILWVVLHVLLIGGGFLLRPVSINTSLFAILPRTSNSDLLEEATNKLSVKMNSRIRILVGASDYEKALETANNLASFLDETPGIASVQYKVDTEALNELRNNLHPYRYMLMDENDRKLLSEGRGDLLADQAIQEVFGPFSIADFGNLENDPYMLTERYIKKYISLSSMMGENMEVIDDVMSVEHEGRYYIFLSAVLGQDHDKVETEGNVIGKIRSYFDSVKEADNDLEFLPSGFAFHNEESARNAQNEISWIGTVSMIALVIILILVFRSPVPIISSVSMIGIGAASAFSTTLLAFGEIHMFTLILGTSLIGVTIDYAFHFFVEWKEELRLPSGETRDRGKIIKNILPGIGSGMITTVISYGVLLFVPIPLLRQIALFSIIGITSAFFSVLLIFPLISYPKKRRGDRLTGFFNKTLQSWGNISPKKKRVLGIVTLIIGICVVGIGIYRLRLDNDIRKIYSMSEEMAYSEKMHRELPGAKSWKGNFIVIGKTEEEVLQNEEAFMAKLRSEEWAGESSALCVSDFLPSQKTQSLSSRLAGEALPLFVEDLYLFLGFDKSESVTWGNDYAGLKEKYLTPELFFQSKTTKSLKDLWLGKVGGYYATIVFFSGPVSDQELKSLCQNGGEQTVFWMNTPKDISAALQKLCKMALILVGGAYLFIFIILSLLYGWRDSLKINAVPLSAALLTLGVLGLTEAPFNLFAVFGLILTLGIGIDYTLFLYHQKSMGLTFQAVFLSFVSTMLAFGALGLSTFPPVADFGRVIFWGILFSFLLSFAFLLFKKKIAENK